MGGPVALAAPGPELAELSMDTVLGAEDPAAIPQTETAPVLESELSTGSLDGAKSLEKPSDSSLGNDISGAGSAVDGASLAQSNQALLKSAAKTAAADTVPASKPSTSRYFIQPASGYNWGVLHNYNAVDIANSCGTPVHAAAAGTVIEDPNLGSGTSGWNGGYGTFIYIEHPNGTKTRYAHLSKVEVAVGDHVDQGQEIGLIGNTGHVQGQTGCHLHFEVIGAPNPFAHGS